MRIPIFVSRPSTLNPDQEKSYQIIREELDRNGLEERRLGSSDYPTELPLREVYVLAKHCAGGIILGFEQLHVLEGISKRGTEKESQLDHPIHVPTPWNHLEAGILFGLGLPLLVFREEGITGGVFDHGVSDAFVHRMPPPEISEADRSSLSAVVLKWQAKVRENYYK